MKAVISWVWCKVDNPAEKGRYLVVVELKDYEGKLGSDPYTIDTASFNNGWEAPDYFDYEAGVIAWAPLPSIPQEAWTTRGVEIEL